MTNVSADRGRIIRLLAERAAAYTPEWRFVPGEQEPGAAVAGLFAELFAQTVSRYETLPRKYYVEFLKLLGVKRQDAHPASGFVRFEAGVPGSAPVRVPKGTEVFASGLDERIVYTTTRMIEATPARIDGIYYADGDVIERLPEDGGYVFFAPSGENLQRHSFAVTQNDILSVSGPCSVMLKLRQKNRFPETDVCTRLADGRAAKWSYLSGGELVPFDAVAEDAGTVALTKLTDGAFEADGDGRVSIYCDVAGGLRGTITLAEASLRVQTAGDRRADSIAADSVPISQPVGGYAFGRRPAEYDTFYVRSDAVFSKRGAVARCTFDVVPVVVDHVEEAPKIEFKKRVIEKTAAVKLEPDDVSVSEVVWEYYNGLGWARLNVAGDVNPFSARRQGRPELTFTIPRDSAASPVNAEDGYYIRARVTHVENFLSVRPRYILPFVREVRCDFYYDGFVRAEYLRAYNNLELRELEDAARYADIDFTVYEEPADRQPAMYFAFDGDFHGMPMTLMFDLAIDGETPCAMRAEVMRGGRFVPLRSVDYTSGMSRSGNLFLYVSEPVREERLFGRDARWLRITRTGTDGVRPRAVERVITNAVTAIAVRDAGEQYFSAGGFGSPGEFELLRLPVRDAELSVMEDGQWRRWRRAESLLFAGADEEVFELDGETGVIRFGTGTLGKAPPGGERNIRVRYTFGGGEDGNLPAGAVDSLVGSVPRITDVENVTPMSGGAGAAPQEKAERLGKNRFRHRFVPVSKRDFEDIVIERFERAAMVRCYPGVNGPRGLSPGHVTVAVAFNGYEDDIAADRLCADIFKYLAGRCDCNLAAGGRLHVLPATDLIVSAECTVKLRELDTAQETSLRISEGLREMIDRLRGERGIGSAVSTGEIEAVIKGDPNVESLRSLLVRGQYVSEGKKHMIAPEDFGELMFCVPRGGESVITVI